MAKHQELQKRDERALTNVERMGSSPTVAPHTDIYEREDAIVVVADMPGVDEKAVDINVERGVLTLEGRVELEVQGNYQLEFAEYMPTSFRRSFTLSNEVNTGGIQASIKDGVLRIVLPKADEARTRKIPVQLG
jgi:HSP20 family molecular chaperone IbpA